MDTLNFIADAYGGCISIRGGVLRGGPCVHVAEGVEVLGGDTPAARRAPPCGLAFPRQHPAGRRGERRVDDLLGFPAAERSVGGNLADAAGSVK
jgi:hypothetical protein